jgi:probable F420-dependent oxidoreductase
MRIGVTFPQSEIGTDPAVLRDYFQAIEGMGYDYVTLPEHVLGAGSSFTNDWRSYYTRDNAFHEPFVLYGFAAALTTRLELALAILVLPQRQTALVAKQAAELDMISGGRVRMGVGLGWNEIEFTALNENFQNRGRRMEEQVDVLRRLWSNELVTFKGEWHDLDDVGLNPMPVQRPIPLWVGAFAAPAVRRAGRIGDGWIMNPRAEPKDLMRDMELFADGAAAAGRDPRSLGIEATVWSHSGAPDDWARQTEDWRAQPVTHLTFRTMQAGYTEPGQHLEALRRFREALG